jgi:hypothetical protein
LMTDTEMRRADDKRIDRLDQKIDKVAKEVTAIGRLLITEPEASALGRALLGKAVENRRLVDKYHDEFEAFKKEEFQPLDDWWNQSRGAWKFVMGVGTVLGIIGAVFGLASYFGLGS